MTLQIVRSCNDAELMTQSGFEIMELDPPEATLIRLETDANTVVGRDWCSRLDKVITSNLGKYRKYKGNSVRDLLRAMRNKVGCSSTCS